MYKPSVRGMIRNSILAISFLTIGCSTQGLYAETRKPDWAPDISGGVTFETKYIWRGQNMVDDPVVQPEASVSKYGLTFSYWGNVSTASSQERWTEHDYTIDYSFNADKTRDYLGIDRKGVFSFLDLLGISFGNIFYVFPEYSGKNFHSEEFYFGVSLDTILHPYFKWYVDYARGAGSYLQLGIGHKFDLKNGIDLKINTIFAYNAGQWGYGYKFAPLLFSGEVNIPIYRYFTITPNINYSLALDRGRKDDIGYGSEFYGGVKGSVSF